MDVLDLETTMGSLSATLFTNLELLVVENSSASYGHFDQTYPKTFFVFKSLIDAIAWTVFLVIQNAYNSSTRALSLKYSCLAE